MLFNLEDWENIIHFGNLFASFNWEKNILFGFGNDSRNRSLFYSEKNHVLLSLMKYYLKYSFLKVLEEQSNLALFVIPFASFE